MFYLVEEALTRRELEGKKVLRLRELEEKNVLRLRELEEKETLNPLETAEKVSLTRWESTEKASNPWELEVKEALTLGELDKDIQKLTMKDKNKKEIEVHHTETWMSYPWICMDQC